MVTSVKLDEALKQRLIALAARRQRSPYGLPREAAAQFVEREETRDQFQQEALAAWKEYRQTGRHLTGDEVRAALAGWGTETERELPDCPAWLTQVVVTEGAARGLERCRRFLVRASRPAARKAAEAISQPFRLLETLPAGGRVFGPEPWLRELVIPFGQAGYVALYRYKAGEDTVYVPAFRHQREAGY